FVRIKTKNVNELSIKRINRIYQNIFNKFKVAKNE
ncbi:unnamed protein product, partial [marine sediment metagenome]